MQRAKHAHACISFRRFFTLSTHDDCDEAGQRKATVSHACTAKKWHIDNRRVLLRSIRTIDKGNSTSRSLTRKCNERAPRQRSKPCRPGGRAARCICMHAPNTLFPFARSPILTHRLTCLLKLQDESFTTTEYSGC